MSWRDYGVSPEEDAALDAAAEMIGRTFERHGAVFTVDAVIEGTRPSTVMGAQVLGHYHYPSDPETAYENATSWAGDLREI